MRTKIAQSIIAIELTQASRQTRTIRFFMLGVASMLCSSPAFATIYYVAPNGSDSNPGTISQPWATPIKARDTLVAGDTVYFRQGTYLLNQYLYINKNSGTVDKPITWASYREETAILVYDNRQANSEMWAVFVGRPYYVFENIEVTQSEASAVALGLVNSNTTDGKSYVTGFAVYGASTVVRNCHIHNVRVGVYVGAYAANVLVEDNRIEDTQSHGFYITGADGIFRNNDLDGGSGYWNQQGIQIQYASSKRNQIYGNIIKNGVASGIVFSGKVSNNEVYNNIFLNCGRGPSSGYPLGFWHEDGPIGVGNKFYNNTVIGGRPTSNAMISPHDGQPVEIYNNLFLSHDSTRVGGGPGFSIHDNLFWNVTGEIPPGNLNVDPQLAQALGNDAPAAILNQDSPAIDAAAAGAPSSDFFGTPRPQGSGYDIGAFEFGGAPEPPVELPPAIEFKSATAHRASSDVILDGVLDECDWGGATTQKFANSKQSDNTVSFSLLWNDSDLFFGAKVVDAQLESGAASLFQDDGLELFFDVNNNKSTNFEVDDDRQFVTNITGDVSGGGIESTTAVTASGYSIEIRIPWNDLGVTPTEDMRIGFLVGNNDRDQGVSSQFDWVDLINTSSYFRPNLWGELSFTAGGESNCAAPDETCIEGIDCEGNTEPTDPDSPANVGCPENHIVVNPSEADPDAFTVVVNDPNGNPLTCARIDADIAAIGCNETHTVTALGWLTLAFGLWVIRRRSRFTS
ncbi:MAG: sugar-binding protein [Myxococcota bacterium]